jgi:hypothetical protein
VRRNEEERGKFLAKNAKGARTSREVSEEAGKWVGENDGLRLARTTPFLLNKPPIRSFPLKSALSEAVVWHKDADGVGFGFDCVEAIS